MAENNVISFGERLRCVRTTLGLSAEDVARELAKFNVTEEEIIAIENNQRPGSATQFDGRYYELANWYNDLFHCDFGYLMGDSDYPFGVPVRVQLDKRLDKLTDEQLSQLLKFVELYYDDNSKNQAV